MTGTSSSSSSCSHSSFRRRRGFGNDRFDTEELDPVALEDDVADDETFAVPEEEEDDRCDFVDAAERDFCERDHSPLGAREDEPPDVCDDAEKSSIKKATFLSVCALASDADVEIVDEFVS